jgi:4-oxalocrotonate tautomerase
MPIVHISFMQGPGDEEQQNLIVAVTEAVQRTLGVPADAINVLLDEVPGRSWGRGGVNLDDILAARGDHG